MGRSDREKHSVGEGSTRGFVPAGEPAARRLILSLTSAQALVLKRALVNAKQRCGNPRYKGFRHYGGRGIRVCAEWQGRDGWKRFAEHIGPRPSPDHSLDRIDVDGHYEPGNVRWATRSEQRGNRRPDAEPPAEATMGQAKAVARAIFGSTQ